MSASTRSDGWEEERLAGLDRAHQHYTNTLAHAHCINALEDISKKALRAQNYGSMHSALLAIHETAQKALQRPVEGTRVRCLMPYRGEQGTVMGWQSELDLPLIEWDDLRGEVPEACEPSEYEVIA